jgi:hypothetical protein
MKLNYDILRTELAERFDCKVNGKDNSCELIERPMLFEEGMTTSLDCCYISESIPQKKSKSEKKLLFIICGEVNEESINRSKDSILYFSKPQSVFLVMNAIVEIFDKYYEWEKDLLESLHETNSLDALLQLSMPIFKNPLYLIDSGFYVLAFAPSDLSPDFVMHNQKVDESWIIRGKDDLISVRNIHEQPYFRHLPNDFPRLFINLSEGEYLMGNLSIQASHRDLRECDGYLLTHLASIVRIALLRYGTTANDQRSLVERMLTTLISGGNVDPEELAKVMTSFRVTPGEEFQCIAIRIPKPSGKEYIRNFLHNLGTQIPSIYIPLEGEIAAMVMSTTRAVRQKIDVISVLDEKLKSFGFRIGLSDRFDNLIFLQQYFTQAQYALEQGETALNGKNVSTFTDCCLDYILDNCYGELKPVMLWKEGFKKLLDHDIRGRANYIETLRAFLDNNLNTQRTAEVLHISRNSLLSQLERINALVVEDFDDPNVRFRYELSLLLFDKYYEK